ncbi:hypothetical protein EI613_28200 [Azospirillum sp. 412522]|nr:hypothetical protein [Azospirillum sp. 412522]MBY6265768.1 hypothetical protein [Azospirillum sp. 412522]
MLPSEAPEERFQEIFRKSQAIFSKDTFTITSLRGMAGLAGEPAGIVHNFDTDEWNLSNRARLTDSLIETDILILNTGGEDYTGLRDFLSRRGFKGIICLWMHDNHIAHSANLRTVLEADVYFCSHHGAQHEDYLLNSVSLSAPILPACYRNLPLDTVRSLMARHADLPRLSRVVAPYFLYRGFKRTAYLETLRRECPELACFFTDENDRKEEYYDAITEEEKAARWLFFKSSIVVPLHDDLSIRLFDGLIWGHTVLVPGTLPAFDHVVDAQDAARLGIVRYDSAQGPAGVSKAAREAIAIFDRQGQDGVRRRHRYVMAGHLHGHRVRALLSFLSDFASGHTVNEMVRVQIGQESRYGMRSRRPDRRPLL